MSASAGGGLGGTPNISILSGFKPGGGNYVARRNSRDAVVDSLTRSDHPPDPGNGNAPDLPEGGVTGALETVYRETFHSLNRVHFASLLVVIDRNLMVRRVGSPDAVRAYLRGGGE